MGLLSVKFKGSFRGQESKDFSAMDYGHTNAVDEAIVYLQGARKVALEQDIRLGRNGERPIKGFPPHVEASLKE